MIIVSQDREIVEFDYFDIFISKTSFAKSGTYDICVSTPVGEFVTVGSYKDKSVALDVLSQMAYALSVNTALYFMPTNTTVQMTFPNMPIRPYNPTPEFTCKQD